MLAKYRQQRDANDNRRLEAAARPVRGASNMHSLRNNLLSGVDRSPPSPSPSPDHSGSRAFGTA